MSGPAVVIAGAGPTGLMLAGELTLAGVEAVIVERRTTQEVDGSRAGGLLARTIEVLDQRGIAERFLAAGQTGPAQRYAGITLDVSDFPTRHNYVLALWQSRFEPILADWVTGLGVPILRGREVVGMAQDGAGVDVALADGTTLRAGYLVGCDGGRSLVRRAAGIDFAGWDASTSWLIAEVDFDGEPELGMRREGSGIGPLNPGQGGGPYRVVLTEDQPEGRLERRADPDLAELSRALVGLYGTDFGLSRANWISRFTDLARQAATYRAGRVLVAGDAAHVHSPHGGQGLNTGVQDAVNLGWKLAQVVHGTSPDSLLDTYHAERHPVGARVLRNTMAMVALSRPDDRHQALRDTLTELLALDEPRRRIAGELSALDVHYDLGPGHPLLGRRMPDLDLHTAAGPRRLFSLLHEARPVLLNLGRPGRFDQVPLPDRVRLADATDATGATEAADVAEAADVTEAAGVTDVAEAADVMGRGWWELPVLGLVPAPAAVLIRPDGHVAWTGDRPDPELARALTTWFGRGVGSGPVGLVVEPPADDE